MTQESKRAFDDNPDIAQAAQLAQEKLRQAAQTPDELKEMQHASQAGAKAPQGMLAR